MALSGDALRERLEALYGHERFVSAFARGLGLDNSTVHRWLRRETVPQELTETVLILLEALAEAPPSPARQAVAERFDLPWPDRLAPGDVVNMATLRGKLMPLADMLDPMSHHLAEVATRLRDLCENGDHE